MIPFAWGWHQQLCKFLVKLVTIERLVTSTWQGQMVRAAVE
jgi:hypothetical protein